MLTIFLILLEEAVIFDWVEWELSTGDVGMAILVVTVLATKSLPKKHKQINEHTVKAC